MYDRIAIGAALRLLRERAGLSQRELAGAARITPAYVSRMENGRVDIGLSVLLRVLDALGSGFGGLADAVETVWKASDGR
ncbi:MAG: helix-turn-helix domain-containing protein [Solirubrobacteraceae bacterium]